MTDNNAFDLRAVDESGDERLSEVFSEYVDRLNAGETLDKQEIKAAHPEFAAELLLQLAAFVESGDESDANQPLGEVGDYELLHEIGRGGMGVVYQAWQGSMNRQVALKVLPAGIAADTRAVARFVREAQVAGKLSHPNVVSVYGMGVEAKTPYYSMEFVEGETLAQILGRLKETQSDAEASAENPFGATREDETYYANLARAFAGVAEGLQHAHSRGVVHRDIKPSNLILETETAGGGWTRPKRERPPNTDQGGTPNVRLRILDFGLARLEGQESLSVSGDVVGTPLYMSPEQARARKIPVDHRTDIYSLGATMYELLTWLPPF